MTIAEIERAVESKKRVMVLEARERASADYTLADLIGLSVSRIYSSSQKMPDIGEVYPSLFDTEEIEERKRELKAETSAIRFKQFATSFNKKIKEEAKDS